MISKQLGVSAFAAGLVLSAFFPATAEAKDVCGWYAIAFCSKSQAEARRFVNEGWGALIHTSDYKGFAKGLHCVVSGPQSKASAQRDADNAPTPDAYIKRACVDERLVGD